VNPFFSYFGGKHALAKRYPKPLHRTIVEPFAGSAGYSTRHWPAQVVLIEKSPRIAAIWRYLIAATPREILALPDVAEGQRVEELTVCDEARWLIGLNIQFALGRPPSCSSTLGHDWGRARRARIAAQLARIRHWTVIEGDYSQAPDIEATWFIDPPYEPYLVEGGRLLRLNQYDTECNAKQINFTKLGAWCRSRRGQVMVCEGPGARWLPFRPFLEISGAHRESTEVIWTNDAEAQATEATA
jgi:hypothetical protein